MSSNRYNRYNYVRNSSLKYIDLDGNILWSCVITSVVSVTGVVTGVFSRAAMGVTNSYVSQVATKTFGHIREGYTIDESLKSDILTSFCFIIICTLALPWLYYLKKVEMRGKKNYKKASKPIWIISLIVCVVMVVININLTKSTYESLNSPKRTEYVCVVNFKNGKAYRGGKKGIIVKFDDGRSERVTLAGRTYTYGWGKMKLRKMK